MLHKRMMGGNAPGDLTLSILVVSWPDDDDDAEFLLRLFEDTNITEAYHTGLRSTSGQICSRASFRNANVDIHLIYMLQE